jgi:gas vesicle protein
MSPTGGREPQPRRRVEPAATMRPMEVPPMPDLMTRVIRELPDTDRDRYDIAYQRGRAQTRSLYVLGGLVLGAVAGGAATMLLDPERGPTRRRGLARTASRMAAQLQARLDERMASRTTVPADRAVVPLDETPQAVARSAVRADPAASETAEREQVGAGIA